MARNLQSLVADAASASSDYDPQGPYEIADIPYEIIERRPINKFDMVVTDQELISDGMVEVGRRIENKRLLIRRIRAYDGSYETLVRIENGTAASGNDCTFYVVPD